MSDPVPASNINGNAPSLPPAPALPRRACGSNFGVASFTPEERQHMTALLTQKLNERDVSFRAGAGNQKFSYIEGWKAIEIANDAFGPSGWSCEIIDLCTDFCESVNDRWTIGVSALVRVTLKDGCFHEDLGFGSAENMKGKHNAMEKAKKEAVTDARKRVLRLFGNGLGNSIADKEHIASVQKSKNQKGKGPLPPSAPAATTTSTSATAAPSPTANNVAKNSDALPPLPQRPNVLAAASPMKFSVGPSTAAGVSASSTPRNVPFAAPSSFNPSAAKSNAAVSPAPQSKHAEPAVPELHAKRNLQKLSTEEELEIAACVQAEERLEIEAMYSDFVAADLALEVVVPDPKRPRIQ